MSRDHSHNVKKIFGLKAMPGRNIEFDTKNEHQVVHENLQRTRLWRASRKSCRQAKRRSLGTVVKVSIEQGRPRLSIVEKLQTINTVFNFLWKEDDGHEIHKETPASIAGFDLNRKKIHNENRR